MDSLWIILGVLAFVGIGAFFAIRLRNRKALPPTTKVETQPSAVESRSESVAVSEPAPSVSEKLGKTRSRFLENLGGLFSKTASEGFESRDWEELEEGLLAADVGMQTTTKLLDRVREIAKVSNGTSLRELVRSECRQIFGAVDSSSVESRSMGAKPLVISIVGVNGVGKTTTIGKLANRFSKEGKKVLLGAADTFRAGAISQLKVWAERVDVPVVAGREGGDPGAVAFDAVTAGQAREMDIVLLDTAGRLHTKSNLMDELKKVHRVMTKVIPEAPHETWLVLDGTLGQNSLRQATEFGAALNLTGVIVSKLDGTAKGGALLAISSELKIPVRYIGLGEGLEDLIPFEPDSFLDAVLGTA